MRIGEIISALNATVICGCYDENDELMTAFGADLMSDMLAFVEENTLILTGMVNQHVLRTAEMLDVRFVLFVRDKRPTAEMIELANDLGIVLLATEKTLFTACGILYQGGLTGCTRHSA